MNPPLPTLDQVLADPGVAADLSSESIAKLLAQVAVVQSAITARLVLAAAAENGNGSSAPVGDEMLTIKEVAKLLRREPRWIWRNKSRLPFLRRVGNGRGLLASRRELDKYMAAPAQRIK